MQSCLRDLSLWAPGWENESFVAAILRNRKNIQRKCLHHAWLLFINLGSSKAIATDCTGLLIVFLQPSDNQAPDATKNLLCGDRLVKDKIFRSVLQDWEIVSHLVDQAHWLPLAPLGWASRRCISPLSSFRQEFSVHFLLWVNRQIIHLIETCNSSWSGLEPSCSPFSLISPN